MKWEEDSIKKRNIQRTKKDIMAAEMKNSLKRMKSK